MTHQIIALMGWPKAGKSEVMRILQENHGYEPIDPARPMRQFAMDYLGATHEDVYTQAGKARTVPGKNITWRECLGMIGASLEGTLGIDILAEMALHSMQPGRRYCYGSLRRQQAALLKRHGALIVHIEAPWATATGNVFDVIQPELADVTIHNDGTIADLVFAVSRLFEETNQ